MKKIAVFTSGGDAPGMNACIRSVVRTCLNLGKEVYGVYRGYAGLISNDFQLLDSRSVSNIIQKGGTFLHSARSQEFRTKEGRAIAYQNLKARDIDGIVAIGGDGTFTGANIFMKEYPDINIVGCPGTIDNDLFGTDYTIGYLTAINTAMNAIDNIKDTAGAHDRLFFIEVMGRDAGFIALRSGIATGAEAVMVPETSTDQAVLMDFLENKFQKKKSSGIVIVAEGDESGGAKELADQVRKKYPHFDIRVTILGHVQRGGRPTCMERVNASQMGMEAVKALLAGKKGVMIGLINKEITYTPFEKAIKHNMDVNKSLLEMVELLS
jgi:6-phosphofructokinase 1